MLQVETRALAPDEYADWNRLVEETVHGTHFHRSEWMQSTGDVLDLTTRIYGCFIDETLVGGCTLYTQRISHTFNVASSVNRLSPYGGLVVGGTPKKNHRDQGQRLAAISAGLIEAFAGDAYDEVQLLHAPGLHDIRRFTWAGWQGRVLYTYVLRLGTVRFDRNARRQIASAVDAGVSVERSEDIGAFFRLLQAMYANKRVPFSIALDSLAAVFAGLKETGRGELWVARADDHEIVAADLLIVDSKRAYRWMAALDPDHRSTGAAYLLLSRIFEELNQRSIPEMNMMSANVPRLVEFASKFDPELVPYYSTKRRSGRLGRIAMMRGLMSGPPSELQS